MFNDRILLASSHLPCASASETSACIASAQAVVTMREISRSNSSPPAVRKDVTSDLRVCG